MMQASEPLFVLHSRPYRESSALVDVFGAFGRVRTVLRAARSRSGSLARPFIPLEAHVAGRGELKNLQKVAALAPPYLLQGQALFSGFYLNELLVRLLPAEDPYPALFELYGLTLAALAQGRPVEPLLRTFEWRLLDLLGYGFSLTQALDGEAIETQRLYRFLPDQGFEAVDEVRPGCLAGAEILALERGEWDDPTVVRAAKRLMRQALAPHLGSKPLMSRELFAKPSESSHE